MACSPAISLYAGRRASAIAGALFAFARAWRGRSDHAKKKTGQTSQARRKRRPLRSCHGSAGNRQKRTAETAPARSQAARWSQNPTDAHRAAHRASKRPKPGENTPQKKHPAKRQIQSPQRDRPTPQQKPRRRIPQSNRLNLKAKPQSRLDRRPRSSRRRGSRRGAAEPALEDHRRRPGATLDGSAPKLSESDQSPDALRRPLLRARMAARTRHSRKVEETDSRGSKAPETARRAPRGSAKKKTRAQLFLPENAKIKKYEKISQKLLTKPPARCIMYVQSTPKVHTRR